MGEEIREAAQGGAHDGASAGAVGSSQGKKVLRHVSASSAHLGATGEELLRHLGMRPKHIILGYEEEGDLTRAQLGASEARLGANGAQLGANGAQLSALNEDDEELVAIHQAAMAAALAAEAEAAMAMHEVHAVHAVHAAKADAAHADTAANNDLALQIDDLALQIPFRVTREAQRQAIQSEALRPRLARHGAPHCPSAASVPRLSSRLQTDGSAADLISDQISDQSSAACASLASLTAFSADGGANGGADGGASGVALTTAPASLACHTAPGPTRRSHLASSAQLTTRLDFSSSASQPQLNLQPRRSAGDLPRDHLAFKRPLSGAPRTSASLTVDSRHVASLSSPQTTLPGSLAKGSSYVDYYKRCHVAVAVGAARRFTQQQLLQQGAAVGAAAAPTAAPAASASIAALAASYGSAASEPISTAAGMAGGAPGAGPGASGAVAGAWSKGGDGCGVGAAAVVAGTTLPAAGTCSAALRPSSARPLQRVRSAPAVKHAACVRPRTAGTARPNMDTVPVRPKLVPGTARPHLVSGTALPCSAAPSPGEPLGTALGTALFANPVGAQHGARPSTAPHRLSDPNQEVIGLRWARLPPPSDAERAAVAAAATAAATLAAYEAAGISVDDEDDEDDEGEEGDEGEAASQQALPVGAVGGTMLVGGLQVPTTARASGGFRLAAPPSSQALAPHRVMPSVRPIRRDALVAKLGSGHGFGATLATVAIRAKAKLVAAARQALVSQVTQAELVPTTARQALVSQVTPTGTPLWPPPAHPPAAVPSARAPAAFGPNCAHDGASFEDDLLLEALGVPDHLNAVPTQIRSENQIRAENPFGWASALEASHAATQKVIKVSAAAASELCGPHAHRPKLGISEHRTAAPAPAPAAAATAAATAAAGATATVSSMHRPKLGLHGSGSMHRPKLGLHGSSSVPGLEGGGRSPRLGLARSKHASVAELAAIGARGVPFPLGVTQWVHAPAARDSARADRPAPSLWGTGQVGVTVASHPFAHWMLDPQAPARSAPETTALLQPVVHGEHVAEDFEQLWGVQRPNWVSMTLSNG